MILDAAIGVRSLDASRLRALEWIPRMILAAGLKDTFDWILVWQESRIGSRAVLDSALKRLAPDGRLWAVTALRKVQGPKTPAAHRLEPGDVEKAFAKERLSSDREARLSAWHVAHRFTRKAP